MNALDFIIDISGVKHQFQRTVIKLRFSECFYQKPTFIQRHITGTETKCINFSTPLVVYEALSQ